MQKTLGLVIAALLIGGCGRGPDYERAAKTALHNAQLTDVDADYDSSAKVVHLKGTVPSETERRRAGQVVQQAIPAGAQVANEVTVAGAATQTADDLDSGIETRLKNMVSLDSSLKDEKISFDANNGVVTITGEVSTPETKQRVGDMARREPGVRDLVNSLEVKSKTTNTR